MKINIGSGPHCGPTRFGTEGWICVDSAYDGRGADWQGVDYLNFNLTETWPLPREVADCIFASHILEHIVYEKQRKLAEEAYRVLKTGAPMRIICPDPRVFFRNWQAKNWQFVKECYGMENWARNKYEGDAAKGFTDMFFCDNYDHVLAPGIDMIAMMLIRAGFSKVTEMQYSNTEFPQFYGAYDSTLDNRPVMSWYLEAVK